MAQKNRTKKLWLIPKRVNLHQMICLIDGIIQRNYDGTVWNPQKQNNLGVNLKNWGATKDGKNISVQGIRTLFASVQYLAFSYINVEAASNTVCLTKAGSRLWEQHRDSLVKIPNLSKGKNKVITESDNVLRQLEKLQISNPVLAKECKEVEVFPFRLTLKLLRELEWLDKEEIAYFVFRIGKENEAGAVVEDIKNFRATSETIRSALIKEYENTPEGSITLHKASSAGYYMALCIMSGIIEKIQICPPNAKEKKAAIRIKKDCMDYVNFILDIRYKQAETFDFGDDMSLWIEYMEEDTRDFPPVEASITNGLETDIFLQIYKDGVCRYDDVLRKGETAYCPVFVREAYEIVRIDMETGAVIDRKEWIPDFDYRKYRLEGIASPGTKKEETVGGIAEEIRAHLAATLFSDKVLNYLTMLKKLNGLDRTKDKSLRGSWLEYLYYKLLRILKEKGVIDEVIWNGKLGKYNLPVQAPGGSQGTPDMVFQIGELFIVLELTTIKSKSEQFKAEGASVPDHFRLYKELHAEGSVVGIYCAPIIHERVTNAICSTLSQYGMRAICIDSLSFLEILEKENRQILLEFINR